MAKGPRCRLQHLTQKAMCPSTISIVITLLCVCFFFFFSDSRDAGLIEGSKGYLETWGRNSNFVARTRPECVTGPTMITRQHSSQPERERATRDSATSEKPARMLYARKASLLHATVQLMIKYRGRSLWDQVRNSKFSPTGQKRIGKY